MNNKMSKSSKTIEDLKAGKLNAINLEVIRGGAKDQPEPVQPCGYPYDENGDGEY